MAEETRTVTKLKITTTAGGAETTTITYTDANGNDQTLETNNGHIKEAADKIIELGLDKVTAEVTFNGTDVLKLSYETK